MAWAFSRKVQEIGISGKMGRVLACFLGLWFFLGPASVAARDVAVETVTIVVEAPVWLYLRVGSEGAVVDQISFNVNRLPGEGSIPGQSTGQYPVPVQIQGQLTHPATIGLTANSATALRDAQGNQISFNTISWTGTGVINSGTFNATALQTIFQRNAPNNFNYQATMVFYYNNLQYRPAGTYHGQVTYTLSLP